jgi:hypothetical protein
MTTYIDSYGQQWELIDFHVEAGGGGKRRVALGSQEAHGRAFRHRTEVRVFWFGFADRDTDAQVLRVQFRNARSVEVTAGWQSLDRAPDDDRRS